MFKKMIYLLLISSIAITQAQTKKITGVVTDDSGNLPGVSVTIKGTANGTDTDFDGKYSIEAKMGDKLVFTYLGFRTAERVVGKENIINVKLYSAGEVLDEVVITAYGYNSRKAYSITSSSIKAEQRNSYHNKIANQLRGQVSSVNISKNNQIKIRGANSVSKIKDPLYIVDGVPINSQYNSMITKLDKNDIEHINVYKNDRETEMFGYSAKNE